MNALFLLLGLFKLKHWLADYVWQTTWHLKKGDAKGWVLPLAHHASIHAISTAILALGFLCTSDSCHLWLIGVVAVLDFTLHFTMDRVKASPSMLGRWKPTEKKFWVSLGFDQLVHGLTDLLSVYLLWTLR